jgi:GGDEF domain-containing protein
LTTFDNDLVKEHPCLTFDFTLSLEQVSAKVQNLSEDGQLQDLCISKNGKYYGTVSVSDLLKAMTDRNNQLARAANPLTGLPGNIFIQGEIEKRISQNEHLDVSYVDIDNFKPYNDH